jgi:hypothetical protein
VPRKLFGRSLCLPIKLFGEERVDTRVILFLSVQNGIQFIASACEGEIYRMM